MANGSPPLRQYDLLTGRIMRSRCLAVVDRIKATSKVEMEIKESMRGVLELLETSHAQIAIAELACQQLWQHFDRLQAHRGRCRGLQELTEDIAALAQAEVDAP